MARKACIGLFFVFLFLSTLCVAQKNEFSVSVGATVASGTKGTFCNIFNFVICNPVQFGLATSTAASYEGTYARQLGDFRVGTLYIELPILGIPGRNVHDEGLRFSGSNNSGIFVTPSLRLKMLPKSWISPFASAGGGFAYFGNSFGLSNTSAAGQLGIGADFKSPIRYLGFRVEARDFITGRPKIEQAFGGNSVPNHQHNLFMGGGVVLHF
ncbi:MAG TPA: hypothetical protein VG759_01260 [Candidatus Angelobacter sp.]|jgi:hypothetical protein|nr:hypothetical protein [Candidatus Angelobacter sp.]